MLAGRDKFLPVTVPAASAGNFAILDKNLLIVLQVAGRYFLKVKSLYFSMDFLVIFGRFVFYRRNNDMKKWRVFRKLKPERIR